MDSIGYMGYMQICRVFEGSAMVLSALGALITTTFSIWSLPCITGPQYGPQRPFSLRNTLPSSSGFVRRTADVYHRKGPWLDVFVWYGLGGPPTL